MNNQRLHSVILEYADSIEKNTPGYWCYHYLGKQMLTITDESHNRMRIISPIRQLRDVSSDLVRQCMEANFDRALDVRYCISGEYLWSAFIHPLEELDERFYIDAMRQVATLSSNYETTFTSSNLFFGNS